MRSFIQTLALCAAMMYMASAPVMAQQISIVSGKVLNLPEGEKKARPFPVTEKVYVFAFNTVAAARDALKQLEGGGGTMMSDADAVAGPDGYYEIRVAENGALIFRVAMKSELLEVNYKQTIDLSIDGGIALDEVEVVAESKRPQPKPGSRKNSGQQTHCRQLRHYSQQLRSCKPPAHHATLRTGLYHRRYSKIYRPYCNRRCRIRIDARQTYGI